MKTKQLNKQELNELIKAYLGMAKNFNESYLSLHRIIDSSKLDTGYLLYDPESDKFLDEIIDHIMACAKHDEKTINEIITSNEFLSKSKKLDLIGNQSNVKIYQNYLYNLMNDIVLNDIEINDELLKSIPDIKIISSILINSKALDIFAIDDINCETADINTSSEFLDYKEDFFKEVGNTFRKINLIPNNRTDEFVGFIKSFSNIMFNYNNTTKDLLNAVMNVDKTVNNVDIFETYRIKHCVNSNTDLFLSLTKELEELVKTSEIYHKYNDELVSKAILDIIKAVSEKATPTMGLDAFDSWGKMLDVINDFIDCDHKFFILLMKKIETIRDKFFNFQNAPAFLMVPESNFNNELKNEFINILKLSDHFNAQLKVRKTFLLNLYKLIKTFNS